MHFSGPYINSWPRGRVNLDESDVGLVEPEVGHVDLVPPQQAPQHLHAHPLVLPADWLSILEPVQGPKRLGQVGNAATESRTYLACCYSFT